MHVTVPLDSLMRALRVVAPALTRSNPLRVSSCLITATDGRLSLLAASLDWQIEHALEADILSPGAAHMSADLARAIPWASFGPSITLQTSGSSLHISGRGLAYTLPMLAPVKLDLADRALGPLATASGSALARALLLGAASPRASAPAAADPADSPTPPPPPREAVWVETRRNGEIVISSTDRYHVTTASIPARVESDFRVALPAHAALTLSRAAAQADSVEFSRAGRGMGTPAGLRLSAGPATMIARPLAAPQPDPSAVPLDIPEGAATLPCPASALLAALRAVLPIAGTDPEASLTLAPGPRGLSLTTRSASGAATAQLDLPAASWGRARATARARTLLATLAPLRDLDITLAATRTLILIHAHDPALGLRHRAALAQVCEAEPAGAAGAREPQEAAAP